MPTIQQLVRKGRETLVERVNHPHWIHVRRDVVFACVFTLQLRRSLTLQCVK